MHAFSDNWALFGNLVDAKIVNLVVSERTREHERAVPVNLECLKVKEQLASATMGITGCF